MPSVWAIHSPSLCLITVHPTGTKTSCCRLCRRTLTWGLGLSWSTCSFSYGKLHCLLRNCRLILTLFFFLFFLWTESWVWSVQFTRPLPATATLAERNSPGKNQSLWCFECGGHLHSKKKKKNKRDLFNWHNASILNRIIRNVFSPPLSKGNGQCLLLLIFFYVVWDTINSVKIFPRVWSKNCLIKKVCHEHYIC